MRTKVLIGSAVILAIGGVYWGFRFLVGKELTPWEGAKIVPQEAIMTAFISTDSKDWSKLQQFGTPEAEKLFGESLVNWQQEVSVNNKINYEKDIKPWLGNLMIAFFPSAESTRNTDNLLVVVGIKNKLKASDFAKKLKEQEGQQIQETEYKGIKIAEAQTESGSSFSSALLNDKIVLASNRKTVELAIDTFKGEPSLASEKGAKQVFSQKLDVNNPVAQVYFVNYAETVEEIVSDTAWDKEIPATVAKNLEQIESVVMGVEIENQGLHFQAIASVAPGLIEKELPSVKGEILSRFSTNAIAVFNGQGINETWSNFATVAQADPNLNAIVTETREFFQPLELDADRDVFGWMDGEFALGVVASKQGFYPDLGLGGAIMIETSDPSTGNRMLQQLEQLTRWNPFVILRRKNIEGRQVTEWMTPQQQVMFTYGWLDNNSLLIGLGVSFTEVFKGRSTSSLVESENFKATTDSLPENNLGYFYFDLEQAMSAIYSLPQLESQLITPEVRAVLNSIEGVGVTATIPNRSTSQFDLLLSLKPNKE